MPALKAAAAALALALLTAAAPGGGHIPNPWDVLSKLNAARHAPRDYAEMLRSEAREFDGTTYRERDGTEHGSFEGAAALREAAGALAAAPAVGALLPDQVLTAAARDHVAAQGRVGGIGHASAAGASPGIRVQRRGGDIYVVEAVGYGMRTAEAVVRQWMVDDGVAGRGHRKLLMTSFYRYAGIWCGPHATRGTMCVIDLAATPGGRPAIPTQR